MSLTEVPGVGGGGAFGGTSRPRPSCSDGSRGDSRRRAGGGRAAHAVGGPHWLAAASYPSPRLCALVFVSVFCFCGPQPRGRQQGQGARRAWQRRGGAGSGGGAAAAQSLQCGRVLVHMKIYEYLCVYKSARYTHRARGGTKTTALLRARKPPRTKTNRERGDENPVKCPPVSVASRHVPTHQRALLSYVTEVSEVSVAPRHVPTHHRVRSLRTRRCAAGRCDGYGATVRKRPGRPSRRRALLGKAGRFDGYVAVAQRLGLPQPPVAVMRVVGVAVGNAAACCVPALACM